MKSLTNSITMSSPPSSINLGFSHILVVDPRSATPFEPTLPSEVAGPWLSLWARNAIECLAPPLARAAVQTIVTLCS